MRLIRFFLAFPQNNVFLFIIFFSNLSLDLSGFCLKYVSLTGEKVACLASVTLVPNFCTITCLEMHPKQAREKVKIEGL